MIRDSLFRKIWAAAYICLATLMIIAAALRSFVVVIAVFYIGALYGVVIYFFLKYQRQFLQQFSEKHGVNLDIYVRSSYPVGRPEYNSSPDLTVDQKKELHRKLRLVGVIAMLAVVLLFLPIMALTMLTAKVLGLI